MTFTKEVVEKKELVDADAVYALVAERFTEDVRGTGYRSYVLKEGDDGKVGRMHVLIEKPDRVRFTVFGDGSNQATREIRISDGGFDSKLREAVKELRTFADGQAAFASRRAAEVEKWKYVLPTAAVGITGAGVDLRLSTTAAAGLLNTLETIRKAGA